MKSFSIIMPIYNVESYLVRSISSIINQSYKDWELVLVNDGSTDNSGIIIDEFAKKFDNIVTIHQRNSGSGVARKNGLKKSKGKYIVFVDPDDYLDKKTLMDYSKVITEYSTDILICGYKTITDKQKHKIVESLPKLSGFLSHDSFIDNFERISGKGFRPLWNKAYRKEFLDINNINFTDQRVGQDALFNYEVFKYVDNLFIINKSYYYYDSTRDGSAVKTYFKDRFKNELNLANEYYQTLLSLGIEKKNVSRLPL